MSKKTVSLTLFSVFLLITMVITMVSAQVRTVGVNVDDSFKYGDIIVNWSSNDPNATWPPFGYPGLAEINETEWFLLSIVDVSDTNITFQIIGHYKNGTEETTSGYIDIDTGDSSEDMSGVPWIISADLGVNDTLYSSGIWSDFRINETIFRTYPDESRDTNHVNMTEEYEIVEPIYIYQYFSMNYYWDQSSGILVEWSLESVSQIGDILTSWSFSMRIIESNVWVIPEFHTRASVLLVLMVLTFGIAIYKRRLLKTPIH